MEVSFLGKTQVLEVYRVDDSVENFIPILQQEVFAGSGYNCFENASLDFPDSKIDLNELFIKDKDCTYLAKVSGDSLNNIGIFSGDYILFQMGLDLKPNDLVVAYIDGEFYGKKIIPKYNENNQLKSLKLKPENDDFQDIVVTDENEFMLYGVITWSFHNHRK